MSSSPTNENSAFKILQSKGAFSGVKNYKYLNYWRSDNNDLFPEVYIFPDFKCADGEVWKNSEDLTINEASRKKQLW